VETAPFAGVKRSRRGSVPDQSLSRDWSYVEGAASAAGTIELGPGVVMKSGQNTASLRAQICLAWSGKLGTRL